MRRAEQNQEKLNEAKVIKLLNTDLWFVVRRSVIVILSPKSGSACFDAQSLCLKRQWEPQTVSHSVTIHQVTMSLNVPGVVLMVVFYLMVLGTGLWASVKSKRVRNSGQVDQTEVTLLGNRGISLVVGIFTMTGERCGSRLQVA